ncbi:ABC transporter permease [Enterococcus cecorum]|uniref:ABC transporter permease n=1 Tax=Enterococcus cecorum TaxID=44008 RepID=UPI0032C472B3
MSLSDLTREFFRQLQEMSQFKLNLLFANLSIVIMVSGYLDYFTAHQSVEALFFLLFTWYFATHSITHPTFFVEDEVYDRTLISVIQSRKSLVSVLLLKIIVQMLIDLVKAIPLFLLIAFVMKVPFSHGVAGSLLIFLLCFVVIFGLYGMGLGFAGFSLLYSRTSSVTGLISYFMLFFTGILTQSTNLVLTYLFPYQYLRRFILQPNLATASILSLYVIIYWVIGLLVFYALFSHAKKKGAIFNV